MSDNLILYCVAVYFVAMSVAGVSALSKKLFRKSLLLFVGANLLGFSAGAAYMFGFRGENLVLAQFDWFFHFAPTLTLLSAIFFTLVSLIAALVGVYGIRYLEIYKNIYNPRLTQFLTAFFVLGMQGVLFANNTFSFLFFWELMSITSFFLVIADRTKESVKAAFLYFIMTHLGASAILGGFLILGQGVLLFDFGKIASMTASMSPDLVAMAFLLFLFGFGSKAGLVPFHVWLPEAHPQAPSNISALMSGLMLKIAVYGFIKVVFSFALLPDWAGLVVIFLGLLSGFVGVLYAVIERDIKRAFACSSIENMGIIFTMLGVALYLLAQGEVGEMTVMAGVVLSFAILHAINHAFFKTGLFLASGVVLSRFHSKRLEVMGGLAKLMPLFSFAFLLVILASLPLPPFGTFFGEWGFIQGMIALLYSPALPINFLVVILIILALLGLISGLAVFAMVKIFGISMLGLPRSGHIEEKTEKSDYIMIIPILVLGLGVVMLGFFSKNVIAWLMGYAGFLTANTPSVVAAGKQLSSESLFLTLAFFLIMAYVIKRIFVKGGLERSYQTWDCGQPIDASMEYTSSAFSAPIRFFFLNILGRDKILKSTPVVETNSWIRNYEFTLSLKSVWKDRLYEPIAKVFGFVADGMKKIQGGRIQYYLLFFLGTLIVTLLTVL